MGLGWTSKFGTGKAKTRSRRPGSHLDHDANEVEQQLLREPVLQRMGADKSRPVRFSSKRKATSPDSGSFDPSKRHAPTMLVTDLSLRLDPAYEKISRASTRIR